MRVSALMVDDESDVAQLYRYRCRPHFAKSGGDALGKLAGVVEPTLIAILSDINMPGWTGSTCSARSNDATRSCR